MNRAQPFVASPRARLTMCAAVFGALAAALVPAGRAPGAGKRPTSRSFRMGMTAFPYDMSGKAVADVGKLVRDNADLVAVYLEGVPWQEAGADRPFHKKMLDDWKRQKATRPPGGKLYLALTPINGDHSALAAYRRERDGLPMPEAFVGKSFDAPVVMDAYLRYCRRAIDFFQPDYLAVGLEVNELFHKAPKKWRAYAKLHRHVYAKLKADHPKLPIFVTFTLHNMVNPDWKDRRTMVLAVKRLMPHSDFVAVSFYPFLANLTAKVGASFQWLGRQFDRFDKPYALCKLAHPAEPLVLDSLKLTIPSSAKVQRRVLSQMLGFARARRVKFVVWFVPRDYDALWERVRNTAPEFVKAWRDCGLLDGEGKPRPAFELWQKVRKLPLRARTP